MVVVVCPCCNSQNVDKDKDFPEDFKCGSCGAEFDKNQAEFEEI